VTWVLDALALGADLLAGFGRGEDADADDGGSAGEAGPAHPAAASAASPPAATLRSLMASPSVLKLFHGSASDLTWLARDLGWRLPAGAVWDTAAAAQAAGLAGGDGLAALLAAAASVAVAGAEAGALDAGHAAGLALAAAEAARGKKGNGAGPSSPPTLRCSDWRVRPLSAAQVTYAARDAHYLEFAASALLSRRAGGAGGGDGGAGAGPASAVAAGSRAGAWAGLSGWAPPTPAASSRAAAARVLRAAAFTPPSPSTGPSSSAFADAVLALAAWRDAAARRADVGPASILPDAALAALASSGRGAGGGVSGAAGVRELSAGGDRPGAAALVCRVARTAAGSARLPLLTRALAGGAVAALEAAAAGAVRWGEGDEQGCGAGGAPSTSSPPPDAAAAAASSAARAAVRRARAIERFRCKRVVYEDCRLFAADGATLLACCDRAKIGWYVSKNLAVLLPRLHPGAPPSARLTFAHRDDDQRAAAAGQTSAQAVLAFYAAPRPNACVGCGEDGHWLRYRLVPSAYRKPLPPALKSHRAHDVVLLCVPCHERAMKAADGVKRAVAGEVGIPLGSGGGVGATPAGGAVATADAADAATAAPDPACAAAAAGQAARRAAVTLHRHGDALPADRRAELEADLAAGLAAAGAAAAGEARPPPPPHDLPAVVSALAAAAPRRDAARMCAAVGVPCPPPPPEGSPPPLERADSGSGCCDEEEGDDEDEDEDAAGPATPAQAGSPRAGPRARHHRPRAPPLPGTHKWHGERVVAALLAQGGEAALHELVSFEEERERDGEDERG